MELGQHCPRMPSLERNLTGNYHRQGNYIAGGLTFMPNSCSAVALITHQISAGHFGQYLRQVRERHGYIGQVLGRGVVHDAE